MKRIGAIWIVVSFLLVSSWQWLVNIFDEGFFLATFNHSYGLPVGDILLSAVVAIPGILLIIGGTYFEKRRESGGNNNISKTCILWKRPSIVSEMSVQDLFELKATYVKDVHWWRYLLECRECGQQYFFEFYEEVDWQNGNDPQFSTYIPVNNAKDIDNILKKEPREFFEFAPRLQIDFPREAKSPRRHWIT